MLHLVVTSHETKKRWRKYLTFADEETKFCISRIFLGGGEKKEKKEKKDIQEALLFAWMILYSDYQNTPQRVPSEDPKMLFKL